jgi:hypothetical protein
MHRHFYGFMTLVEFCYDGMEYDSYNVPRMEDMLNILRSVAK